MKKVYIILIITYLVLIAGQSANSEGWRRLIDKETFEIVANPKNWNTLVAGGPGRTVFFSNDGGLTWDTTEVIYPAGAAILNNMVLHPKDTNVVIIGGLVFGEICRTTNRGKTWESVFAKTRPITLNGKAMELDSVNDYVYIGDWTTGTIFRSPDRGMTWDSISTVMRWVKIKDQNGNIRDTLYHVPIGSIALRQDSLNIMFVNSTDGEVFVSNDSGVTWRSTDKLVKPGLEQTDCEITRMTFSDRDPRTGYCVITYLFHGNTPNGGCYKTTDGGYNWDLVALKDTSMWAVACRKYGDNDEVFVGGYTEDFYVIDSSRVPGAGIVHRSLDGGKTWYSYDDKMDWWNRNFRSDAKVNAIFFQSEKVGFAGGAQGILWRTINSGYDFRNFSFEINENLNTIFYVNDRVGFLAGDKGYMKKSVNYGFKWNDVVTGTNKNIYSLKFTDTLTGYFCGAGGSIAKSIDQGTSWTPLNSGTTENLLSIFFTDLNTGYAVGSNGTIIKTIDSGANWIKLNSPTDKSIKSVHFVDPLIGYIVGENGTAFKTVDAGANWQPLSVGTTKNLTCVHFANQNIGYIVGDKGTVLKTSDGGNLWIPQSVYGSYNLTSVYAIDDTMAVTGGENRMIYRTTDGGTNWEIKLYGYGATANVWSQRYWGPPGKEKLYMATEAGLFVLDEPSPVFEDISADKELTVAVTKFKTLKIAYDSKDAFSMKTLEIFDLLGRPVFSKIYQNRSQTLLEDEFDVSTLTGGCYVVKIRDGRSSSVCKVILQ